jgi:hypothetical protein
VHCKLEIEKDVPGRKVVGKTNDQRCHRTFFTTGHLAFLCFTRTMLNLICRKANIGYIKCVLHQTQSNDGLNEYFQSNSFKNKSIFSLNTLAIVADLNFFSKQQRFAAHQV